MPRYEGILNAVVAEKRQLFLQRLFTAFQAKYGDAYDIAKPQDLPHGAFSDLSKACGVTAINVRLWVSGKTFPSNRHIAKLAKFFGLSVEKFLGKELYHYYKLSEESESES